MSKFVASCEGVLGGEGCKEIAAVVVFRSYHMFQRNIMIGNLCMKKHGCCLQLFIRCSWMFSAMDQEVYRLTWCFP